MKNLNLTIPTIRNQLKLNISQAFSFNHILNKSDIPYDFNLKKNYWWRWYSEIFGFYYNRIKRTYCVWVTTFLKKNLDVKMPFFFSIIDKNTKPLNKYKNYIFLYNCSLNNINFSKLGFLIKKPNFEKTNFTLLSESAKNILFPNNRKHRAIGSSGILDNELNMFFSSYNSNWNNLYNKNSIYKQLIKMSKNYLIIINNYNFNTSFFINSFDSILNVYPQYYLNYIKNLNYYNKFNKLFNEYTFNLTNKKFKFIIKNLINFYYNKLVRNYNVFINKNIIISYFKCLNYKLYNQSKNWNKLIYFNQFNKNIKLKWLIFFNKFLNLKSVTNYINLDYKKFNFLNVNKLFIFKFLNNLIKNKQLLNINVNLNMFNKLYNLSKNHNNLKKFIFKKFLKLLKLIKLKQYNYFNYFNLKKKNENIIQIKWTTKFKKYNQKYFLNYPKLLTVNFVNLKKSSKFVWYFLYDELLNKKIKFFISKLMHIIFSLIKLNFNINKINYIYYLKYTLVFNYLFLIKYIKLNVNINYKFNYFDKQFINIISLFKQFIKLNNHKNLKVKNLTYIKYI